MEITFESADILDVKIHSNGLQGGDSGHGGFTEIELKSTTTSFTLENVTTGVSFGFVGLSVGETIYIDNEKKQIISSTSNYRLGNFNKNWMYLEYGDNEIQLLPYGAKAIITFRTQYPQAI